MEQLDSLRKIGVAIYYPSFVPPRFSSVTVTLTDAEADKKHFDYSIEFCDRKEHCFSIESAYSGIGDGPDGDRVLKGTSKIFGNFRIDVFKPFSEGNNTKDIYYLGSWMKDKKAADAEKKGTWTNDARHYHFLGTGITDQEAQKIVTSLVPVTNCRTK